MFFHAGDKGMRLQLLVTQRHSLFLSVGGKHQKFIRLSYGKHFVNRFNMVPGQIYNMRQAVKAVYAYERAEGRNSFYDAAYDNVGNNVRPENFFLGGFFRFDDLSVAGDDFMFCVVYLQSRNAEFFTRVSFEIADKSFSYLRCGDKNRICPKFCQKAAFYRFIHCNFKGFAVSYGFDNLIGFFYFVHFFL